jgi:hypothetical protein
VVGAMLGKPCAFSVMDAMNTYSLGVVLVSGFGLKLWLSAPY